MVWLIAGILIGVSVGFHAGWYGKQMLAILKELKEREPEPEPKVVIPTPPEYAAINNTSSAFINPKTPEVMRYEEEQRIRRATGQ